MHLFSLAKDSLFSGLGQVVHCACQNQNLKLASTCAFQCLYIQCYCIFQALHPSCSMSQEYIMQEATIFGRGDETKVTRYQKQVNEAAIDLALHTPSLLSSRQTLLKEA